MAAFPAWLFVPGAWSTGPTIWSATTSALQAQPGHILIPTLPKAGAENVTQASVDRYAQAYLESLSNGKSNNVAYWIVAHSAGGGLAPAIATILLQHGVQVLGIVLVTSFIPIQGQSVFSLRPSLTEEQRAGIRARMQALPPAERILPIPTGATLDDLYLASLPATEASRISASLVPEPFIPLDTPADYTPFGKHGQRIPIHYIFATQDRALPIELQRTMVERLRQAGCAGEERSVAAGHNVLLTHPEALSRSLLELSSIKSPYRRWRLFR
jgi:pimeloyl-ACP methyl ester carboxylesterase